MIFFWSSVLVWAVSVAAWLTLSFSGDELDELNELAREAATARPDREEEAVVVLPLSSNQY